ncbi:MAG: FMN-binding protein [Christensenellales bacterium]|nr:FMN-binding protein [Christensenellales bacterium]
MTRREMAKSILVLVLICVVISGTLSLVNSYTAPVIEEARIAREIASRKRLLMDTENFEELTLKGAPESVTAAHKGTDAAGNLTGYVFTVKHKGFGGFITIIVAIDPSGKIVRVATMDVNSETKTLGGLVAKADYTDQYIGKDETLTGVDGITGATITSDAYEACIRDSFVAFKIAKGAVS